jgi:hypothetical protein
MVIKSSTLLCGHLLPLILSHVISFPLLFPPYIIKSIFESHVLITKKNKMNLTIVLCVALDALKEL